ncbi:MAG: TetR/AcrR family transcriptional regulator [Anaerolineae bacterium]
MARVVKEREYAVRRDEILDVAQRLVQTKGYAAMTIQDILDGLGISKGAFYHYFDSKGDLLEGIIERMLTEVEGRVIPIVADPELSALDKFHRFFSFLAAWKTAQREFVVALLRVWYTDENAVVRQKARSLMVRRVSPLVTSIIRQGVGEGVWSTPYPDGIGEVVLSLLQDMSDALAEVLLSADPAVGNPACAQRKVAAYTDALERVLGAQRGSLEVVDDETLDLWFEVSRELVE